MPVENDALTYAIIGCAMKVRDTLGNGLLESAYEKCLIHELTNAGFSIVRQVARPLIYDGIEIENAYRPDVIVDQQVIVEVKAVTAFLPVHEQQLLTYLRLTEIERGLLLNFHAVPFRKGIKRMILSKKRDV